MAYYSVNKKLISNKVQQAVIKNLSDIENQFRRKIIGTRDTLINRLDSYQISKELSQPNPETKESAILPNGNLFSFLGFYKGDTPYENLRNYIQNSIYVNSVRIKSVVGFKVKLNVTLNIPNSVEIEQNTSLPWGDQRSWVRGLEFTGFDNFAYYLYKENKELKNSRSTTGLQIKNEIRSIKNVAPQPYVNSELKKLRQILKSSSKA